LPSAVPLVPFGMRSRARPVLAVVGRSVTTGYQGTSLRVVSWNASSGDATGVTTRPPSAATEPDAAALPPTSEGALAAVAATSPFFSNALRPIRSRVVAESSVTTLGFGDRHPDLEHDPSNEEVLT